MSDFDPATVVDTTPNEIPIPIDDVATASTSKPEYVSETLYIQNLNEKIRIDGSTPVTVVCTRVLITSLQSSNHPCAVSSSLTVR